MADITLDKFVEKDDPRSNSTLDKYIGFKDKKQDYQNRYILKEPILRYQKIWKNLLIGNLKSNFKLEFKKKNEILDFKEFYRSKENFDINKAIKICNQVSWRKQPYDKQHWGNWLHSLSPYQGRLTPSFVHWLIRIFSSTDMTILDPFCGVGTVPLEADFLNRKSIGNDLNPYAYLVSKGKFDRRPIEEYLNYLKEISDDVVHNKTQIDNIPKWIKDYFHSKTLKEIVCINKKLEDDEQYFLRAGLMGVLHGNRPGYLSVYTGCIIPMKPRSKDHPKFRPEKDSKEYRGVIPRLAAKVMRMHQTGFELKMNGKIICQDARNMNLIEDNSVDVVICSPPYYNTLDYATQNRVRLFFLGYDLEKQGDLKKELIQKKSSYIEEMIKVGKELKRVVIPEGYIVCVLGDVVGKNKSINTAENVAEVYQDIGYEKLGIINDEIPINKRASGSKSKKFDRILIMKNIK